MVSVYTNGGTCNPHATRPSLPRATHECSDLRNISLATGTNACSAPPDMWAAVPSTMSRAQSEFGG
eukprot:3246613-Prymnesium_polylepis.1